MTQVSLATLLPFSRKKQSASPTLPYYAVLGLVGLGHLKLQIAKDASTPCLVSTQTVTVI